MRDKTKTHVNLITQRLVPAIENINSACFDFTEEEARAKGLWKDVNPMPTHEELDAESIIFEEEENQKGINRKAKRKAAFQKLSDIGISRTDFKLLLEHFDDEDS